MNSRETKHCFGEVISIQSDSELSIQMGKVATLVHIRIPNHYSLIGSLVDLN